MENIDLNALFAYGVGFGSAMMILIYKYNDAKKKIYKDLSKDKYHTRWIPAHLLTPDEIDYDPATDTLLIVLDGNFVTTSNFKDGIWGIGSQVPFHQDLVTHWRIIDTPDKSLLY